MLPQLKTVVTYQHYDGVTIQSESFQLIQYTSDLCIHKAYTGIIAVTCNTRILVGYGSGTWHIRIGVKLSPVTQSIRSIVRGEYIVCHPNTITIIHVPIFPWRYKREVRFVESDSDKERLIIFGDFLQRPDTLRGVLPVGQQLIFYVSDLISWASLRTFQRHTGQSLRFCFFKFLPSGFIQFLTGIGRSPLRF